MMLVNYGNIEIAEKNNVSIQYNHVSDPVPQPRNSTLSVILMRAARCRESC